MFWDHLFLDCFLNTVFLSYVATFDILGAKREPNGVRGSGVKTKEIECDIVLKHEGGKLGSPLLL